MGYELTTAVRRALELRTEDRLAGPGELVLAAVLARLLAQPECRAALLLADAGISQAALRLRWPELDTYLSGDPSAVTLPEEAPPHASYDPVIRAALEACCRVFADHPQPLTIGSEHLLVGLATLAVPVAAWLTDQGFDVAAAEARVHRWHGLVPGPLPHERDPEVDPLGSETESAGAAAEAALDVEPLETQVSPTPDLRPGCDPDATPLAVWRILDAASNRALEGLRVVEDYVRFALDDRHLTEVAKTLRHDLAEVLSGLPLAARAAARETQADVGTRLTTPGEYRRGDLWDVALANSRRTLEALRSLEEHAKLVDAAGAARCEQIRYRMYTLEKAMLICRCARQRLAEVRLYLLVDGRDSIDAMLDLVDPLLEAGVDAVQLRDKRLGDRQLLERARALGRLTRGRALLIVNDRPDLAVLAEADGVHVGQEELTVADARRIVGPGRLIGVSTHSLIQARQAVLDGADYLGVGPTFPSSTKQFSEHTGTELVRAVAAEIRTPAFAIGGIGPNNAALVLAAGASRLAVSGAVLGAADRVEVVGRLRQALRGAEGGASEAGLDRQPGLIP